MIKIFDDIYILIDKGDIDEALIKVNNSDEKIITNILRSIIYEMKHEAKIALHYANIAYDESEKEKNIEIKLASIAVKCRSLYRLRRYSQTLTS